MSDSLTTLISKVQNLLGDAGATYFSTALVTAAVRQALKEFNLVIPRNAATTITGVNNQYEYELSDYDASAIRIIDVLLRGASGNEFDISLTYDEYSEDERLFFRLREPVSSSDTLIVRYTLNHTINGLDSEVQSTILAHHDQIVVDGACYYSILARATARIEANNLDKSTADNYREVARNYQTAFKLGLADAQRRMTPVGEPDTRAWNDGYHHWGQ